MSEMNSAELQKRRDALARELAELQWDLGGLAYEMAIRDHFRLDVLMRQAGRLQEVDARLGEVEHLLRLETASAAGACPQCGTLYARGALYCSQCAFQLVQVQHAGVPGAPPAAALPSPAAPAPAAPPGLAPPAPAAPAPRAPTPPAPAAPDAPYGIHGADATVAFDRPPDERDATIAFERPAEERSTR